VSYTIIVEQMPTGYSAYPRDLPGVGAAARTLDEIKRLTVEAIQFHLESFGADRPTGFGPTDEPRFIILDASASEAALEES
jgi:predicted RNase H-like HicB family nuclease